MENRRGLTQPAGIHIQTEKAPRGICLAAPFVLNGNYAMIALQASTSASLSAADSAWDFALVLT